MSNTPLRLVTLNVWGGRSMYPLIKFFEKHKDSVDVFCLQEVLHTKDLSEWDRKEFLRGDVFQEIANALPGHQGSFAAFDGGDRMSNALFVRRSIRVSKQNEALVFVPTTAHKELGGKLFSPRKLQTAVLEPENDKPVLIANMHGLWNGGDKLDCPERIEQSQNVRKITDTFSCPVILCGDFNLQPDTDAFKILAKGMNDLVRVFEVASTRTKLYRHHNDPAHSQFADYVLTSPDVRATCCRVLPDLVSDHAPLYVEFST